MATTIAAGTPRSNKVSLLPDLFDRILAAGAIVLLGFVLAALWRGQDEWHLVPLFVWLHLGTIVAAVALTPVMLLRRRGDRLHRRLGWVWAVSMFATAAFSFGVSGINPGGFSLIHILSAWTLIQVPVIAWTARTHRHRQHRGSVRGMVAGALLIAGFFTFPFDRMLGHWLFA